MKEPLTTTVFALLVGVVYGVLMVVVPALTPYGWWTVVVLALVFRWLHDMVASRRYADANGQLSQLGSHAVLTLVATLVLGYIGLSVTWIAVGVAYWLTPAVVGWHHAYLPHAEEETKGHHERHAYPLAA